MKVTFKDLSIWLKIPIVSSWIVGTIYLMAFSIGFIIGLAGLYYG